MNRAAISIPEKLFFKIGEVCEITDVQAHVLRYWESEFPMLAPQKNRAGQRTYRKRDVEMVLRIKELLYEDQYTIAGAKKKLSSELRGASKLKVVTPEMSAQATPTAPQQPQTPQIVSALPPAENEATPFASPTMRAEAVEPQSVETPAEPPLKINDDQRAALRRLKDHMKELLVLLEAGDTPASTRRK
ncbi:MAG TPA: MerR family transcriptional regulator [Pyrinomonadaceae bacterium]|nr:MerR family transcriptional regulator [Pyrinomonadaceae bacterium]